MKFTSYLIRSIAFCCALMLAVPILADETVVEEPLLLPSIAGESREEVPAETYADSGGLTLAGLESIALAQNPALARAAALVSAARGDYLQVGLMPNPSVGYEGQQLGSGGRAEQHGVTIGQEIVTAGKLRLSRAVAGQRIEVAQQEYTAARFRVLTDVRIAFYEALVAQRQGELAEELLKISAGFFTMAGQLEQAKEVGRIDVLQANLERQQAEMLVETSRQRYDAAWRRLAAATGSTELAPLPLVGAPFSDAAELPFQDALSTILSRSPETAAAAAQVDRAAAVLRRERAEPIPNVTFLGLVN
jgi:cobalt-zinc-cadmium efflux system outer membrane protein